MRPSEVIAEIKARFLSGNTRAIHLVSKPGEGKTSVIPRAAKELSKELGEEIGCLITHAPLQQPEDYGIPVTSLDRESIKFIVCASKYPIEGSGHPKRGIWGIDELPQTSHAGQAILANMIQAREIHGYKLMPGWTIVSTGNRAKDKAGAGELLSHLKDRVTFIEFDASIDDWTTWALENAIPTELIAFLRFKPELLSAFDPQLTKSPTPRAWSEGVARSIGKSVNEFECFKGDVGEGAAAEFVAYLKMFRKLPTVEMVLLDPVNCVLPDIGKDGSATAVMYAICGALGRKATKDNFGRIMTYVQRMPQEFSVLFTRDATRCMAPVIDAATGKKKACGACQCCEVTHSREFIQWLSGPGAKLLA